MPSHLHQLFTPNDIALALIDYQPQMTFGVSSMDRTLLMNNTAFLAKAAKLYKVPVVLTAVETESFSGYLWPQLMDVFPNQTVIERSSMNAWDDVAFRKAIEATGRKKVLLGGLWTEVCVAWPALSLLGAGFHVYVVEDCCGATSKVAQRAAMTRMTQAGVVPLTTIAAVLELQRDWSHREHYDALMNLLREHAGVYGSGVEYAYTMVHKAPQATQFPHKVVKQH